MTTAPAASIRHLAVGAAKDRNISYQTISGALPGSVFSAPAYFNNTVYFGAVGDSIKAFAIIGARLSTTPTRQTSNTFGYPDATPSVSANGTTSAILWAVENGGTAVLHAYDVTDISRELYNSNQAPSSRDHFGPGNKFITPTIINGKIYLGTTNGVAVFGLLH